MTEARTKGGVVGSAEIVECRSYRTAEAFARDRAAHLNDPTWFRPPVLYGFVFAAPAVLPYLRVPGWMRFFHVEMPESSE